MKTIVVKTFFLLIAVILFANAVIAQQNVKVTVTLLYDNTTDTQYIYYKPNTKLEWNNFIGKPKNWGLVTAVTASGIGYQYNYKRVGSDVTINVIVYCPFNRLESWVLSEDKKTDYTLNHEQRHFDISYINTWFFIQSIQKAKFTNNNYKALIDKLYTTATANMNKMQSDYDRECRNGLNKDKQEEWNVRIETLLCKLPTETTLQVNN